jgi:hypothetical protein
VPLLVYCNVPIHQTVGTSAACGLPIAVAGAIGFVYPRPWWPGAPSPPRRAPRPCPAGRDPTPGFAAVVALIGLRMVV